MPYGFIVFAASTGLATYFVFATEASWIGKVVVSGLYIFSFAAFFGWIPVSPLIGQFLWVVLGIIIMLYRAMQNVTSRR